MKRTTIDKLKPNGSFLLPDFCGDKRITQGGLYAFEPGEIAHREPVHVHDVDEVFIFVQGKGVLPIDGIEHPVEAGDVIIVEAGEDHHTRSSDDDPLVAAWFMI